MGALVVFHAHPDDEAMSTGGSMARAHAEGHRVVLVVATGGEHGEVPDDLEAGETLAERRRAETQRSAAVLGVDRLVWLDYHDSGMTGWEANQDARSFWLADLDEAAGRLADVLRAEQADVLTIYDWHGNYGHPDHIKVHQVGSRAEQLVAGELPALRVFQATMNRDEIRRQVAMAAEAGEVFVSQDEFDVDLPMDDGNPLGMPEEELTLVVDVSEYVDYKRRAISSHASQVTDTGMFLEMPPEMFAAAFGREWFIEHGVEPGLKPGWLLDHLAG